jgi:glycosyltransferase involved in cell wall biosynthesis
VTEDWYFLSHRLPMARAARAAGFEVHVATNVGEDAADIREEGFILHPVRFARGRLSPLRTVRTILALRRLYRTVNPAIVHYVAMQPTLLGILASFGSKFAVVYAITGLGYAFVADSSKTRSLRRGFRRLLLLGLNRDRAVGLVQNPDDREVLANVGIKPERIALIPGSGVDADRFRPIPEPDGQVTVAFVGRMLADKGVRTLMEAQRILRASGIPCDLLLAGTPDPANPTSIPQIEVAGWGRESGVTWLGHVADIATVWRRAHIAVLPSRGGEGVPKSLLEAAALGRPLIATDVPGCREIVIHEKTGLLVPVDDPQALAAAILRLVRSSQQRVRFGVAARRLVDERFAADLIGRATVALYQRLLTS